MKQFFEAFNVAFPPTPTTSLRAECSKSKRSGDFEHAAKQSAAEDQERFWKSILPGLSYLALRQRITSLRFLNTASLLQKPALAMTWGLGLFFLFNTPAFAQKKKGRDYLVTISTRFGDMKLVLFDETPQHKQNFLNLTKKKFYNDLLFHRVIEGFMIQGGDPNSKGAPDNIQLGNGDVGYRIPAEIRPDLFHRKGALAAARDNNPEKASSGCQFYIVQGKIWDDEGLAKQMARSGRTFTDEQKRVYKTVGGSPHLDGNYTVFGQTIAGLAVIDSVARQPRNAYDRPLRDVTMRVTAERMRKKKITRKYGYVFE
jgi:peptidyl-prolyl cis-trans isomerase B (cyclophilin B)